MPARPLAASLVLSTLLPVLGACATQAAPPLRLARVDAAVVPPVPAELLMPVNGKADSPMQLDYAMVVTARERIAERMALAAALPRPAAVAPALAALSPPPVQTARLAAPPSAAQKPPAAAPVQLARVVVRHAAPVLVAAARVAPERVAAERMALVRVATTSPAEVAPALPTAPIPFAKLAQRDAVLASQAVKLAMADATPTTASSAHRIRLKVSRPVLAAVAVSPVRVASAPAAVSRPAVRATVRRVAAPRARPAQPWVQRIQTLIRTWLPTVRA